MEKREQYLETYVRPIMEKLISNLVSDRPKNVPSYILEWLQKEGEYSSLSLSIKEKNELENLRKEIAEYRSIDNKIEEVEEENLFSDMDSVDINIMRHNEMKKLSIKGKGKRIGVSAEAYGYYNQKEEFEPRNIKKNEDQIKRIKSKILQSFIFSSLDQADIDIVIGAMEEKDYDPEEVVINQGEQGDCLYVVESGELDCYKKKDGVEELVKQYSAGESFGELALLYNAPRAAKVVAKTKCILWALDRETFTNIVKDAARKKREKYESFLKSVDALQGIDNYQLSQICDALKTCTYKEGEYVIKEGEIGDIFYIIEEGEAVATKTKEIGKPPVVVMNYKKGGYFGELALIRGTPRAANVIAKTDLTLLSLDRFSFKRLLSPNEEFMKWKSEKIYKKFPKKS